MKQSQRVAKNFVFLGLAGGIGGFLNFVSIILVARYLGVAEFGIFSYLLSFAMVFQFLADFGLSNILLREMARHPEDVDRLLGVAKGLNWFLFAVFSVVMLILVVVLPIDAKLKALSLTMGLGYLCLFQSVSYVAVLRANEEMEFNAIGFTLHKVVMLLCVWTALHLQWGLWGVVCSHFAANLFQWAFFRTVVVSRHARGRLRYDPILWRTLVREALPLGAGLVLRQISWQADIFMLKAWSDKVSLGLFSGPFRMLMGLMILASVLALPLFPLFVRLAKDSRPRFAEAHDRTVKGFCIICFPITAIFFVWPELWIRLIFGEGFLPAVPLLQIMSFVVAPMFICGLYPLLYSALDSQRYYMTSMGCWLVLRVVAGFIFIPRYGAMASAVIVLVCETAIFITLVAGFARRGFRISWVNSFLKPLAACMIASLILYLARGQRWEILAFSALVSTAVYLACLWTFRCLYEGEKRLVLEAVGFVKPYLRKVLHRIDTPDS